MKIAAVVPFKCFTRAKRRLRARYSGAEVEEIGRAMLEDVLSALQASSAGLQTVVLSDDGAVADVARAAGAAVRLREPDPGLNAAIQQATQELAAEGVDAVLVVLGDLPGLRAADVDATVDAGRRHAVVIAPSPDGGTALLFRRPPEVIPARFGPRSAELHAAEARSAGVEPALLPISRSAGIDLDTPEDADRLLAADLPCRTRDVLRKFVS